MDKEKAKLIFDKMEEIKKIFDTEPNNTYFVMVFGKDYMNFNNEPETDNFYAFSSIYGEIKRLR